jgi:hypothetical protein
MALPCPFQCRYGHSTPLRTMYEWGLPEPYLIFYDGEKVGHAIFEPMTCEFRDGGASL